jgi:hypothetical protein
MKSRSFRQWLTVAINLGATLSFMIFAFVPFHRQARNQSTRAAHLEAELDAKVAVIESLPRKQSDLEQLVALLGRFRASLSGTDEMDGVMARFRERAEASRLNLWTLNPSVPALIKLEAGGDSLSRLDLAVLPVAFECRGAFQDVARFLESEESRPDFFRWQVLAVTTDPLARGVQARGEIQLFLLPGPPSEEASS